MFKFDGYVNHLSSVTCGDSIHSLPCRAQEAKWGYHFYINPMIPKNQKKEHPLGNLEYVKAAIQLLTAAAVKISERGSAGLKEPSGEMKIADSV